jgi:DNA-binding response OmpR family regulator
MNMVQPPLILAVDDEPNILKLVKINLLAEGYDVITASGGLEALALLRERHPALILLDISMPGLDGFQTVELIRKESGVPVIMLTARDDIQSLDQAMSIGADDFLTKPFSIRELSARVRAKIRRSLHNGDK